MKARSDTTPGTVRNNRALVMWTGEFGYAIAYSDPPSDARAIERLSCGSGASSEMPSVPRRRPTNAARAVRTVAVGRKVSRMRCHLHRGMGFG